MCGTLNAASGRLVGLIAEALDTGAYEGAGIRSPEQWVAWKCGLSLGHARRLVTMARRLPELPATAAALSGGELSEDQVAVMCRHAPPYAEADVVTFAKAATVSQLTRTLRRYVWSPDAEASAEDPEARRVRYGTTEEGTWRLSALLPVDEGALVERALDVARRSLVDEGVDDQPSWADALVSMAERSLGAAAASRPHHDRHLVVVHLRHDEHGPRAALHAGPPLPHSLRRLLGCDGRIRPLVEVGRAPLSVGRAQRIVPERTRLAVEERDGACRVPGCERSRWLQVHHITHWEDGGATDTANLVALCSRHHRMHHLGRLGIEGDGDDPEGLVFSDARGRTLTGCGRPAPPVDLTITGKWSHPSGERLDSPWVQFREPSPPA